ncbi:ceramide synthase 4 [Carettochelys insculpta]|uniref:ceramide synthase 4 n=1 Tax=Carettochelys insculpta TaxID=44489 RepID=UPI003EB9265C
MMHSVNEWFWWHEHWLPPGLTWEDMQESEDVRYPQPQDLLLSLPCTLLLVIVRYLFERFIALPLGRKLGLRDKVIEKVPPNPVLENFYTTHSKEPKKMERDLRSDTEESDVAEEERDRMRAKERNGALHVSNLTNNNCTQKSRVQALSSRARLANGHAKGR